MRYFILLIIIVSVCACICVHLHTCVNATVHKWISEDNIQEFRSLNSGLSPVAGIVNHPAVLSAQDFLSHYYKDILLSYAFFLFKFLNRI